jgi:predicted amidohydrolase
VREDLTVGIAQWLPAPGRPRENLATALSLIRDLAGRGCDLVVLPELWPCGYNSASLAQDAADAAEPLTGARAAELGECARDLRIWLAAGSVPERDGQALYNTALLYDRKGRLAAWHRKVHLYSPLAEDTIFIPGDRLTVCRTGELGVVGLSVCFDGDFPETARALRRAGATLVVQPSAYETGARSWWQKLYPGAALSNGQWWVLANQCGTNPSGTLLGESHVLSPWGEVVASAAAARDGETPGRDLLVVQVPLSRDVIAAERENGVLWGPPHPDLTVHVHVHDGTELARVR